jgi:hypothetical protein
MNISNLVCIAGWCMVQDNPDPRKYSTYLATRPAKFEEDAAHMLIDVLVEEHIPPTWGFYLHIAHLGDAKNVEGFRVSLLLLLPSLSCTPVIVWGSC